MTEANTISPSDEASLSWYFGLGLSIFDRSTFGAIIRKLDIDAYGSTTCKACEGAGILDDGGIAVSDRCRTCKGEGKTGGGKSWCPDCRGFGTVAPYEYAVESGGWCKPCKGTGATPVAKRARRRTKCATCGGDRKSSACRSCSNCLGTGHEPITAKPIHGSHESSGVQADDSALTRFAITSRRVERVRLQSPALAACLAVYYGDVGQRWAITERGRMFALYHLTPAGVKLAKWGEKAVGKGAELGLTPQERIGTQAALEAEQPRKERMALLVAAAQQAQELFGRAAKAWNVHGTTKRDREDWQRLSETLDRHGRHELAAAVAKRGKALP